MRLKNIPEGKDAMGRLDKFKDLLPRTLSSCALLVIGYFLFFGSIQMALIILSVLTLLCFYEFFTLEETIESHIIFKLSFFAYITLGVAALHMFFLNDMNIHLWVGGALIITIISDVSAYFTGRLIGGMKPFPSISPGKTLSGYLGGLIFGTAIGLYWFFCVFDFSASPIIISIFVFAASLLGQAGDLSESHLKRLSGKKDSGILLPGHGGFLDRFDAFFAAIIMMAICSVVVEI